MKLGSALMGFSRQLLIVLRWRDREPLVAGALYDMFLDRLILAHFRGHAGKAGALE